MDERTEALRQCPVLEGFTDVGLQIIAAVAQERLYANARALQTQSELPKEAGVLFLWSGRVRCEVKDENGRSLGLGNLGPGDHLGGMRLFGTATAPLSAIAEGDVRALLLDRPAFERIRRQKPQTAMKLLHALASDFGRRMSDCSDDFAAFALFAAQKTNLATRGQFSYADYQSDSTPFMLREDKP